MRSLESGRDSPLTACRLLFRVLYDAMSYKCYLLYYARVSRKKERWGTEGEKWTVSHSGYAPGFKWTAISITPYPTSIQLKQRVSHNAEGFVRSTLQGHRRKTARKASQRGLRRINERRLGKLWKRANQDRAIDDELPF